MKLTQEKIDKIAKISKWCVGGIMLIAFAMLFVKPASWVWWTLLGCFIPALIVSEVSLRFATNEEEEEFKKAVKDAVREAEKEKVEKKSVIDWDVKCPLKGLTTQQEEVIINILQTKIHVENGHLKTAELKHLIKALSKQGDLNDKNMDNVIAWVEQVTGEKVDARNLKYDYTAKISDKEVVKWGDKIRAAFEKIEIS